ncbi:MAG: hypothetical protein CL555_20685 [Algoriphagus sp.]|nr:hypothetical protein [Algoriphagus sp.]
MTGKGRPVVIERFKPFRIVNYAADPISSKEKKLNNSSSNFQDKNQMRNHQPITNHEVVEPLNSHQ